MNINAFYTYTLFEIKTYLNAKIEKENENFKNDALLVYKECDLIGASVARLFNKQAKYPKISKVFPGIFEEEKVDPAEQYKADLFSWANAHNERLKRKKLIKERVALMKEQGIIPMDIDIPDDVDEDGILPYVEFIKQLRKYEEKNVTHVVNS